MSFFGYKPSTLILWIVLALPGLTMIGPLFGDDPQAFHRLLHPTGEFAARFMIIGMMASGLMLLFRGRSWPRWLLHHRRDIEVAAFIYAALHTVVYVIDRGTLDRIIEALPQTEIWTGWLAMLIFVPLVLIPSYPPTPELLLLPAPQLLFKTPCKALGLPLSKWLCFLLL